MNRLLLFALPAILLASCSPALAEGSGPAAPAAGGDADEGGALDRLHVYEVQQDEATGPLASDTATAFIEVSGNGQASGEPDMVRIAFAVETLHETAREATEENARRMTRVIAALRDAGIRDLEIETFGYNLQPNYRRPTNNEDRPMEIESYRATNNIRVTAGAVDAAGPLIDVATEAGANRVASLHFDVEDKEPLRAEALRDAVAKAEAEARTIAEALGVTLGAPLEVRGGAEQPIFRGEMMLMGARASDATPIEAGAQTVTANVTIRYRLGGPQR